MFDKSEKFPEGWFFIKNNNNGYVLMVDNESQDDGQAVVLSTLRTKDYSSQLWRHDPKGYLVNKKSGLVMDVAKGSPKAGVDIVQQKQVDNVKEELNFQKFGLSPYGHIYLVNKPSLVLGIKESFFSRREGLHVHLQLVDTRHLDRKEQRWDFVIPVVKETGTASPKRSLSASTMKSNRSASIKVPAVSKIKEDDANSVHSTAESTCSSLDESSRVPTGTFPDTAFFLKNDMAGLYISIESATSVTAGTQLTIDSLHKKNYESQLWKYDPTTFRLINTFSGLCLGIENNSVKDGADLVQAVSSVANDATQSWSLSPEGEITLKSDPDFVVGFKESWFGNREGAHLHVQKRNKGHQHQKFTVVLPIFKKTTTTELEQRGVFPEGYFFVKSQAHGLVLTVLETGVIAAEVAATRLDTSSYSRQLWTYANGYIVNKASNMVLDVRGGSIKSGASLCQYTKKEKDADNQLWALTPEGVIFLQANKNLVLTVKESETVHSKLYLAERKAGHKEQSWNFVLPVFKKKQASTVSTYRYATYPNGWFFIRSISNKSTTESPLVLTALEQKSIQLSTLDRQNWQYQLWTFSSGKLINYATDLVIDVTSFAAGASIELSSTTAQKWYMTMDGYLIYGDSEEKSRLALSINDSNQLSLSSVSSSGRWGFLIPKFTYKSGIQILVQWSIWIHREWRITREKVTQPIAQEPESEFFIGGPEGLALTFENNQVVLKKLEANEKATQFKWTFRNGYLVHCATGLVMQVEGKLSEGGQLQLSKQDSHNVYQQWTLRMDGSIISKHDEKFGLSIVQVNGVWTIKITTTVYYAWRLLYGRYETRYSEKEKKEISYLVSFQRIILTLWVLRSREVGGERKLVSHSYGVFPKGWIFIRSKCDDSLFMTVSDVKKGAKLILAKLDSKNYRRQLWRYREDGCIVNFETDYVIDIAGGKIFSSANIIQWSPKFLRSSRKNQVWGLTVHGHIHPQSNKNLVLSSVGNHAKEGAELKLVSIGDLSLDYQQWKFAVPVFSKSTYTTYEAQQKHKHSLVFESIGHSCSIDEHKSERYESSRTVIRRWGIFPDSAFFIRCNKNLALTVERDSEQRYRIVVRSLNFKAYKWQLWRYSNGYLVNEETGLVLDAQSSEDVDIEGEQTEVYLHTKSSNDGQFWSLGEHGEIHLRSNERLAIGASDVEGSQVGLKSIRVIRRTVSGKQVVSLQSEQWLRWSFSIPVFGKRTTSEASLEIEKTEEHTVAVKEEDEEVTEEDDDDEYEEETEESEYQIESPVQTPSSSSSTSAAGVAVVTAGTVVAVAAGTTANVVTKTEDNTKQTVATVTAVDSHKSDIAAIVETPAKAELKKSESSKSTKLTRKDSFQLEDNYIPTGFEKIVRFKNHYNGFPTGYFFIKSSLHGYVLDIVGDVHEDSYVVLTRMRSTDFASQLWSFQNGFLVNLKGRTLVLDAAKAALSAGERVHLSTRNSPSEGVADQTWDFAQEGSIHLKSKRSFVLSLKETKRSDKYTQIDVFVHEAKTLVKKEARPEQHWEVLIPSLIPVSQGESGVKVVESGKIEKVTSSASAIISYKWIKETYHHKVTAQNQWPGNEGWFFIRFGTENYFLASGETAQSEVSLLQISEKLDYKRFLWTFVDGYLINYKYMLRLVLSISHRWVLSSSHSTLNQKFYISEHGAISVRIAKIIYYIRYRRSIIGSYDLDVTTDDKASQSLELHIPVISDIEYQKSYTLAYSSVRTWIRKQQSDWSILTSTTIRKGVFPASTWFFIKVNYRNAEDLVLSVQKSSSQLVLKKLDFGSFRDQLWTFNDGLLINYGSKFVIDVQGDVAVSSNIVHSAEAGISTQKWILTIDGQIELDSHDFFVLGSSEFKDGAKVQLASSRNSYSSIRSIKWKFSVPIFGKKTVSSSVTDITEIIESGAVIESAKEVVSKAQSAIRTVTKKNAYEVYHEYRLIIRWWRLVFIRRLSTCKTQKEYLEVIEQYRQILYSRLDQYIQVYGTSISKQERASLESSIEETKTSLETEVFSGSINYLKKYKSDDVISTSEFHITQHINTYYQTVEKKYESIITKYKQQESSVEKQTTAVERYESESEAAESVLVIVDSVQITIRYWFRILYTRISEAHKRGANKQEIEKIIQTSQNTLHQELTKITESTSTKLSQSTVISDSYKKQLELSVSNVVEKSKSEVDVFISKSDVSTLTSEESWKKATTEINSTLTSVSHKCKKDLYVEQDVVAVEEETTVTEVSQEDIECSKIDLVASLTETKAYIISWFSNISRDLTWSIENSKEDVSTVIDASELEIVSKIDESISLLLVIFSSLTYISWSERRRLITYYSGIKSNILVILRRFKTSIATDSDKETLLKICQTTFSEEESTEILHIIDEISTTITTTTTTTTTTGSAVDIVVKKDDTVAVGVIGKHTELATESGIKKTETLVTGITAGKTDTTSAAEIITTDEHAVTVGVVSGETIKSHDKTEDKETTKVSGSVTVVTGESQTSTEVDTKESGSVTIVTGETTTEVDSTTKESGSVTVIAGETEAEVSTSTGVVAGVVAGINAGVIAGEKDTSKVDVVTGSETVSVGVVSEVKEITEESGSVTIVAGQTESSTEVDTVTKDTEAITVISGEKTTSIDVDTKESGSISVVSGEVESSTEVDTTTKETGSVTIISGESQTSTEVDTKESGSVTIVTGETTTEVDSTTKESGSVTVIAGETETEVSKSTGVVAGVVAGVTAGVIANEKDTSKVDIVTGSETVSVGVVSEVKETAEEIDTVTKESGSVTIVAGSTESSTEVDTVTKDTEAITVISGEKTTSIDVDTKESSSITVVSGETSTEVDTATKETGSVTIISGESQTSTEVDTKESGSVTIVTGETTTEVDSTTKESGSVTVIAGETETEVSTSTGVVAGVVAGITAGVIASEKDTSKVDVITGSETVSVGVVSEIKETTEESGSVTIVAGQTESTTEADTVTKDTEAITVISGGKTTSIDVDTKESGSITVVSGEVETSTEIDTATKESSSVTIISGETQTSTDVDVKESGSVTIITGETNTEVDTTTKESTSVTVVAEESESSVSTSTGVVAGVVAGITAGIIASEKDSSKVDVVTGSETVSVGVVSEDKETTEEVTKESGSVTIVAGQTESTTEVETVTKDSEAITVVSGEKTTSIDVDTKESGSITVVSGQVESSTEIDTDTKESSSVTIISGESQSSTELDTKESGSITIVTGETTTEVDSTTKESGSVTVIAGETETEVSTSTGVVAGVVAGVTAGVIASEKDTSKVDIVTGSETVSVGVVSEVKETTEEIDTVTKESGSVTIVAGSTESSTEVGTVTKDTEAITVISGEKTTSIDVDTKESGSITVVSGGSSTEVDTVTKESGSVTITSGETQSSTGVNVEESGSVTIITGETNTEVDTTTEQSGSVAVIAEESGSSVSTSTGVVAGVIAGITAGVIASEKDTSKVDVISGSETVSVGVVSDVKETTEEIDTVTKESGSVTIIAGQTESTTEVGTVTKDTESVTVISGEKTTSIDVDTKESGSITVVSGEVESSTEVDTTTKESSSVTIVSGESQTSSDIDVKESGSITIVTGETDTEVDSTTKESGSVTVITGETETEVSTSTGVVAGVVSGIAAGVIAIEKGTSQVDVVSGSETVSVGIVSEVKETTEESTKESGSVTIIAGETESTTEVGTITKDTESLTVVSGEKITSVDVDTKQSGSITVVSGEAESTTEIDTTTKEASSVTIISGEASSNVDIITKESGSVSVIAEETESSVSTSTGVVAGVVAGITAGVIASETESSKVDVISGSETVSVGVVSEVKEITEESGSVTIVAGQTESSTEVDTVTKDTEAITVISGEKTTSIDIDTKESGSITVVSGESSTEVDTVTKESGSVTIISGESQSSTEVDTKESGSVTIITGETNTEVDSTTKESGSVTVIAGETETEVSTSTGVVAGVVAGITAGVIASEKDSSKVDIVTGSETVSVGVVSEVKETTEEIDTVTKESGSVTIVAGSTESSTEVGTVTKDTEAITVVSGEKTTSIDVDTKESGSITVVSGESSTEVDNITKETGSITIISGETQSSTDVDVKESGSVTIITGEASTEVDAVTKESGSVTVIAEENESSVSTSTGVVAGVVSGITAGVIAVEKGTSKVDVVTGSETVSVGIISEVKETTEDVDTITKESGSVTVIAGELETSTEVGTVTKDTESVTVISGEKVTSIDVDTKESGSITVISGEVESSTEVDTTTKESSSVTIISGESQASTEVDTKESGSITIITGETEVEKSGSVTVIAEGSESTVSTSAGVVSGVVAGITAGVISSEKDASKVDIITGSDTVSVGIVSEVKETTEDVETVTKESGSVTIIAGDTESSTEVDTITKETESLTIVSGEKVTSIDVDTKESGSITVVSGEVETSTEIDTATKESSSVTIISGETQTSTDVDVKESGSVTIVTGETSTEVDNKTRETGSVTVIADEKESSISTAIGVVTGVVAGIAAGIVASETHKSKVDVVTGSETVSVGVVSEVKESTEEIDTVTKESGSVTIIAGETESSTEVGTAIKDSESVTIVSGEKVTSIDVDTKESGSITVVSGEVESSDEVDTTTKESSSVTIISGESQSTTEVDTKESGSVTIITGDTSTEVDSTTKKSSSVTVIAGETETEVSTSTGIVSGVVAGITAGVIASETESSKVDIVTGSETISVGVVSEVKESNEEVDTVTKETGSVTIVAGSSESTTEIGTVTKDTESVTVISGEKVTSIDVDTKKSGSLTVVSGEVESSTEVDTITKESGSVTIISGETQTSTEVDTKESGSVTIITGETSTETDSTTKESSSVTVIAGESETEVSTSTGVVAGVVAGITAGVIASEKDSSKVDVVTGSETVSVGVVSEVKDTTEEVTKESGSVTIIAGETESTTEVDTITKDTESVTVVSGEKTTSIDVDTKESGSITVVSGESQSTTEVDTKESGSVTIIAGESQTSSEVDVKESGSITVVTGETTSEVDTISKESGSATIITGEASSEVDVVTKESGSVTVVTGEANTITEIDTTTKESGAVAIVTGEAETTTTESGSVTVITGETSTEVEESGSVTIVTGETSTEIGTVVAGESSTQVESGSVTVISEKHDSSVGSSIGVVAGVVAGITAGVIASEKETSKVDVVTGSETVSVGVVHGSESITDSLKVGEVVKVSDDKTIIVSKDSQKYATEVIASYEKVTESASGWFTRLIEKIVSLIEIGECTDEVNTVIEKEEAELQVILEKNKLELSESSTSSYEWGVFYKNLQASVESKVSSVKKTVSSGADIKIELEATKQEFNQSVYTQLSEAKVQVYENIKTSKIEVEKTTGSQVVVDVSKSQQVVYVSVEQAKKETTKALNYAITEVQKKFNSWYDIFFGRIRSIDYYAYSSREEYEKEVQTVISTSTVEAAKLVQEAKSSFEFSYTVSEESSADITNVVESSKKQALESLSSIYEMITEQTVAVKEILATTETESTKEKLSIVEEQSRRKTTVTLEATTETAISAGFEGKQVTWIETAQIPESFKDVKVFAFDLADSIVDYRTTISKVWYKLISKKHAVVQDINVEAFVVRWYQLYLEQRVKAKYSESDIQVLVIALRLVLAEYSALKEFSECELETLASAWLKLELFEDASASIKKIKQLSGTYSVAFSHAFTIRTMMDIARHGCLCWNAQFTADMFAACTINNGTSPEVTTVSNTAMLLGLENAGQLAIVSANPQVLGAAKECGAKSVYIKRFSSAEAQQHYDIEFDGLDIFAESFETFFYEAKVIRTQVEVPKTRTWFQRVVSTVTETAESVSHAIVG